MRCNHTSHPLTSFPVYSLGFLTDHKVVLGGGGGAGRSGIKNKLRLYDVNATTLDLVDELELAPDEDAPMTMAVNTETSEIVCGVNSSKTSRLSGDNQNCRVYAVDDSKLLKKQTTSTLKIVDEDADDYQKVTAFSPSKAVLGVGCTNNEVSLLSFPSLSPIAQPFNIPKSGGDIFDIDFYKDHAIVCGSKAIYFLSLASSEKPSSQLPITATIGLPTIPGIASGTTCSFRSARIVTIDASAPVASLYTVVNTSPPRSVRGGKRMAYMCVYQQLEDDTDALKWTLKKTRSASSKAITVFDVNATGTLLAYGSSDLSIGILDAKTLAPLVSILNAHEFPATVLRFSPSATLLLSGSADNSVRVVEVPGALLRERGTSGSGAMTILLYVLLALLAMLAAVYLRQYR